MMGKKHGTVFRILLAGLILGALAACTGGRGAPAPPVEIPSLVTFPATLEINVDTIATTQQAANMKAQVGSGPFTSLIVVGADLARTTFNFTVRLALRPLEVLQIPVRPDVFRIEIPVTEGSSPGTFKIDFSDFDFNGDGMGEGCSGCTCPAGCGFGSCPTSAPAAELKSVCYRVWFKPQGAAEFTRFIAGVFTRLPVRDDPTTPADEENPGNGRFRRAEFNLSPDQPSQLGAVYEHAAETDPRNKSTQVTARTEFPVEGGGTGVTFANIDVNQVGLENPSDPLNLQKTVRTTSQGVVDGGNPNTLQYRGRFREDADFFSGTVVNPGGEVPLFCAQISTGAAAENPGACDEIGISVADLPFLPVAGPSDVDLPADFPLAPTF